MSMRGAGGQTPPRADQQTIPAIPIPVSPGSPAVIRARQVIVSGPTGSVVGVFVYAAGTTPGAGNEPIGSMTNQTQDPFGNPTETGVAGYVTIGGVTYALQLGQGNFAGVPLAAFFTHTMSGATAANSDPMFGGAGTSAGCEAVMFSGLSTISSTGAGVQATDSTQSGIAGGEVAVEAGSCLIQATATTLNTTASSSTPSLNTFPGHQSAAPATYNQSYEQATTNRVNEILDVLTQTGVWHP